MGSTNASFSGSITEVCLLAKDKTANIYTDSRYAPGETQDFAMLWKQPGFATSFGQKVKNKDFVLALPDAMPTFRAFSVINVRGHSSAQNMEAQEMKGLSRLCRTGYFIRGYNNLINSCLSSSFSSVPKTS